MVNSNSIKISIEYGRTLRRWQCEAAVASRLTPEQNSVSRLKLERFVKKKRIKTWSQALPTCAKTCCKQNDCLALWFLGTDTSLWMWIKNTWLHQQLFIGPPDHGRPVSLGTWQHLTLAGMWSCQEFNWHKIKTSSHRETSMNLVGGWNGREIRLITWILIMHRCLSLAVCGKLPSTVPDLLGLQGSAPRTREGCGTAPPLRDGMWHGTADQTCQDIKPNRSRYEINSWVNEKNYEGMKHLNISAEQLRIITT